MLAVQGTILMSMFTQGLVLIFVENRLVSLKASKENQESLDLNPHSQQTVASLIAQQQSLMFKLLLYAQPSWEEEPHGFLLLEGPIIEEQNSFVFQAMWIIHVQLNKKCRFLSDSWLTNIVEELLEGGIT